MSALTSLSSGRTEAAGDLARDDGRGAGTHADAWGAFAAGDRPIDLIAYRLSPLRWFGFDAGRAA